MSDKDPDESVDPEEPADPDEPDGPDGPDGPIDPDEVLEEPPRLPAFVQDLMDHGLLSDALLVAEVSATGGPTYELDEMDVATVENLVGHLDGAGLQWAIDRAGQLVVHRNDERRADAVFEELFGPEDEPPHREAETEVVRSEVESMAARVADPISSSGRSTALFGAAIVVVVIVMVLLLVL